MTPILLVTLDNAEASGIGSSTARGVCSISVPSDNISERKTESKSEASAFSASSL